MTRCSRCGMFFELRAVGDLRCLICQRWTDQQIAADELRRTPRFSSPKEYGTRPAPL